MAAMISRELDHRDGRIGAPLPSPPQPPPPPPPVGHTNDLPLTLALASLHTRITHTRAPRGLTLALSESETVLLG
jgi:hypothetical protein